MASAATQLAAGGVEGSTGALHALVSFLQALTNDDADGRIVISMQPVGSAAADAVTAQQAAEEVQSGRRPPQGLLAQQRRGAGRSGQVNAQAVLKFVLLNAATHFARVVAAAHAVVLASGTLSPLESVLQLFPGTPPHRVHRFACGHVVPRQQLLALALGGGPSGLPLDFRHASRDGAATLEELGRLLVNVCQVRSSRRV